VVAVTGVSPVLYRSGAPKKIRTGNPGSPAIATGLNAAGPIEVLIGRLRMSGFEEMGRPGLVEGTRELVDDPYIVVYRVVKKRDEIVIVSVVHSAQDR
jgi:ParE toxin of type II toxin-antitoxin system, parDE